MLQLRWYRSALRSAVESIQRSPRYFQKEQTKARQESLHRLIRRRQELLTGISAELELHRTSTVRIESTASLLALIITHLLLYQSDSTLFEYIKMPKLLLQRCSVQLQLPPEQQHGHKLLQPLWQPVRSPQQRLSI